MTLWQDHVTNNPMTSHISLILLRKIQNLFVTRFPRCPNIDIPPLVRFDWQKQNKLTNKFNYCDQWSIRYLFNYNSFVELNCNRLNFGGGSLYAIRTRVALPVALRPVASIRRPERTERMSRTPVCGRDAILLCTKKINYKWCVNDHFFLVCRLFYVNYFNFLPTEFSKIISLIIVYFIPQLKIIHRIYH